MAKPLQFNIALESSIFGDAGIENISYNKSKGLATITTKKQLKEDEMESGKIKIGNWTVKCRVAEARTLSFGVIGPIDPEEDLVSIKDELVSNGLPILDLYRLNKKVAGQITASEYVKIGFSVAELPARLHIFSVPFRIRKFEQRPLQCFRCQRFGHIQVGCNSKVRCLYCSGPHSFKDCLKREMKCSNCGEGHLANYRACKVARETQLIENLSREENIPYQDAKARINSATVNLGTSSFSPLLIDKNSSNYTNQIGPNNSGTRMYSAVINGTNSSNTESYSANIQGSPTASESREMGSGTPSLIQDFVSCCNLFTMWQKTPIISDQFGRFMSHYNQSFGSSLTFKKIVDLFNGFSKAENDLGNQNNPGSSKAEGENSPVMSSNEIGSRSKQSDPALSENIKSKIVSEGGARPKDKEPKKNLSSSILVPGKVNGKELVSIKGKRQHEESLNKDTGKMHKGTTSQTDKSKSPKSKRQHHG